MAKIPKVSTLTGRLSTCKRGFTDRLMSARNRATTAALIQALEPPMKAVPGTIHTAAAIETAHPSHCKRNLICSPFAFLPC